MTTHVSDAEIAAVFRREHGRVVAVLVRVLGDIDLAEDAVQEAFAVAVPRWRRDGVPPSPVGWIVTTARNAAVDRLRRESSRARRHADAALLYAPDEQLRAAIESAAVSDDRLRLLFTCCHPAVSPEAQVALTLRLVAGLTTAEIARAFLVPEPTMAQRISRAKRKIRDNGIRYRVPRAPDLPQRLSSVLAVVYVVFTQGHFATTGAELVRGDLCDEAIRLGRLLVELLPDEPEPVGLLALMLLGHARAAARTGPAGELVLLAEQDRSRWDRSMLGEGHELVRGCLRRGRPGPYQLQAAIAAVHTSADTAAETDWRQIVALYDQLAALAPSPLVALNRAIAVAEVEGPTAGLALLDELDHDHLHSCQVTRAELLLRAGRRQEAADAFARSIETADNLVEREHLTRRAELSGGV